MIRTAICTLLFFLQVIGGQESIRGPTTGNYKEPSPDNNGTDSVVIQTQLLFDGGVPICDQGCNEAFACNTNASFLISPGYWRQGNWSFADPSVNLTTTSSEYYLLTQISLTITGVFDCKANKTNNETDFALALQDYEIDNWDFEDLQDNCTCFNCQSQVNGSTAVYYGGWPNYNYNGSNYVSISVQENMLCLNMIVLDLMFAKQVRPIDVVYVNRTNNSNAAKEVYFGVSIGVACTVVLVMIVFSIVLVALRRRRRNRRNQYETINEPTIDRNAVVGIKFTIKEKEIRLGPRIGKGSYGEVYRAEWRGITVAVKRLPIVLLANEDVLKDFQREATIMSSLRHPNVLQFLGSCQINNDVAILTEYMDHGSLYRLLHDQSFDMTWTLIKRFALETAQGMVYLHCSTPPILHRDLKSHNLLVDSSYRLKISDFGLSKVLGVVNQTMTSCGTAAWAAPEVLRNSRYTEKADVFSYGVCLWEFFARQDPYEGMPTFQIIFAVGTEGLRPTIPSKCPVAYRNLIEECWDTNPNRRPNFLSIVERIKRLD